MAAAEPTGSRYTKDGSESYQVYAGAVLYVPSKEDILSNRRSRGSEGVGISSWDNDPGDEADGSVYNHPILVVSRHGLKGENINFLTMTTFQNSNLASKFCKTKTQLMGEEWRRSGSKATDSWPPDKFIGRFDVPPPDWRGWKYIPIHPSPAHPIAPHSLLRYKHGLVAQRGGNIFLGKVWSMHWQDTLCFYGQVPAVKLPWALEEESMRVVWERVGEEVEYRQPEQYQAGSFDMVRYCFQIHELWLKRKGTEARRNWRNLFLPSWHVIHMAVACLVLLGVGVLELGGFVLIVAVALAVLQLLMAMHHGGFVLIMWILKILLGWVLSGMDTLLQLLWRKARWVAGVMWELLWRAVS